MDTGGEYLENRKLHNKGLHTLRICCLPDIIRVIKSNGMRREGHVI